MTSCAAAKIAAAIIACLSSLILLAEISSHECQGYQSSSTCRLYSCSANFTSSKPARPAYEPPRILSIQTITQRNTS